jgi:hypothetical protein
MLTGSLGPLAMLLPVKQLSESNVGSAQSIPDVTPLMMKAEK